MPGIAAPSVARRTSSGGISCSRRPLPNNRESPTSGWLRSPRLVFQPGLRARWMNSGSTLFGLSFAIELLSSTTKPTRDASMKLVDKKARNSGRSWLDEFLRFSALAAGRGRFRDAIGETISIWTSGDRACVARVAYRLSALKRVSWRRMRALARCCHPMASPGTSWHDATEPRNPNSEI